MKLLQELFEQLLIEEWGNLKFIEPKMMNVFKDGMKSMHGEIGRNSTFRLSSVSNATKAFNELEADDVIGFVYFVGSDSSKRESQMFAVGRQWVGSGRKSINYNVALRGGFLAGAERDFLLQKSKLSTSIVQSGIGDGIVVDTNVKEADMRMLILRVMKSADDAGKSGQFIVIKKDLERAPLSKKRSEDRSGIVLTPKQMAALPSTLLKNYIVSFKSKFKERLLYYKNNKVQGPEAADPLKVLEWIMKEGYIDKMKVGKYVYNYHSDSIRFGKLRDKAAGKQDGWHEESYVEYAIEEDDKYGADRRAFWEAKKKFLASAEANGKTSDQANELALKDPMLSEMFIPRRFKIFFKMIKGAIIPDRVEFQAQEW